MRGYLGFLSFFNVLGRWKVTLVRIFLAFFLKVAPDFTAFATFAAWVFASAFLLSPALQKKIHEQKKSKDTLGHDKMGAIIFLWLRFLQIKH